MFLFHDIGNCCVYTKYDNNALQFVWLAIHHIQDGVENTAIIKEVYKNILKAPEINQNKKLHKISPNFEKEIKL